MLLRYVRYLDADGNLLNLGVGDYTQLQHRVGTTKFGGVVAQVVDGTPVEVMKEFRRAERATAFSTTIDRLNPIWYDGLTDLQKAEIAAWRTAWLNYPETNVKPGNLSLFNET